MKIWKWIKSLFTPNNPPEKSGNTPIILPEKPAPEIPTKEEVENFPVDKSLRIALVRGHGGDDTGAVGNGTNEVEYNTWVMEYVLKHTKRNVKCYYGNSSIMAVYKSKLDNPDVTIQLHLNDADALTANGVEVLVIKGDLKSYALAERFASEYAKRFNRKIRREKGKKILADSDRGAASVSASKGIKMLAEPFFIKNKNDFVPKEDYAKFLLDFIETI